MSRVSYGPTVQIDKACFEVSFYGRRYALIVHPDRDCAFDFRRDTECDCYHMLRLSKGTNGTLQYTNEAPQTFDTSDEIAEFVNKMLVRRFWSNGNPYCASGPIWLRNKLNPIKIGRR